MKFDLGTDKMAPWWIGAKLSRTEIEERVEKANAGKGTIVIKYTYVVSSMYEIEKDGDAEIYRDKDKSTLTLITCKTSDFSKQSIIILYLSKTENY